MTVRSEGGGRRSVSTEVEVNAGPIAAWAAVATGPGISSWFVPTDLEPRVGGKAVSHFSPDGSMDSVATIASWDPPRSFVAQTEEAQGTIDTEWRVDPLPEGRSRVSVTHRWTSPDDSGDAQFEAYAQGWVAFFRVLEQYLAHYAGQPSAAFQVIGAADEPVEHAWALFAGPLCLFGAEQDDAVGTPGDDPPLSGTLVHAGSTDAPGYLIRLDAPAPGLAQLAAHAMGDKVYLTARFFLFGDGAQGIADAARVAWEAWMAERFAAD